MTLKELTAAREAIKDVFDDRCVEYKTLSILIDNEIKRTIILNKCNERENLGYNHLTDSDIMDILDESKRMGVELTREEINNIFKE